MTTDTEALTYDHIVALALEHGFKLKPQVDGRMALNDYVIDFARAVYDIGHAAAKAETAEQEQAKQRDAERLDWIEKIALRELPSPPRRGMWKFGDGLIVGMSLRTAIDAARGEQ